MRPLLGLLAASILILVVVACHDPETQPPTSPTLSSVSSVDFVAPASIAPGQSVQLVATVRLSDGTAKTAPAVTVVWRTNVEPTLLEVSSAGVLTAGQVRGEGIVTADVTVATVTRRVQRTILVMPDGTLRLVGAVRDAASFVPVAGARVEVAPGDLSTTTDSAGQYRLYGVPPMADLQVSAAGFEPLTWHVTRSTNATEDFYVRRSGPVLTLIGNYTLKIDLAGGCNPDGFPPLPAGLRHRTYDATLSQNGTLLGVTLSGANFRVNAFGLGNRFSGEVIGSGATFTLPSFDAGYIYYYGPASYPAVAEVLPDGTHLLMRGSATTVGSASGFSGTMDGALIQWDAGFAGSSQIVSRCIGPVQFALTPR